MHFRQNRYKVYKSLRRKLPGLSEVLERFSPAASSPLQGSLVVETPSPQYHPLPRTPIPSGALHAPPINAALSETVREHFLYRLAQLPKFLLKISTSPVCPLFPNAVRSNGPHPHPKSPRSFIPYLSYPFGDFGQGVAYTDILGTVDVHWRQRLPTVRRFLRLLHLPIPAVPEPPSGSGFFRTQPGLWFLLFWTAAAVLPGQHSLLFSLSPETLSQLPNQLKEYMGPPRPEPLHLVTTVQKREVDKYKSPSNCQLGSIFYGTNKHGQN